MPRLAVFCAAFCLLNGVALAQTGPGLPRATVRQPAYPAQPQAAVGPRSSYNGAASTVATTTSMAVLDDSRKLGVGDTISFRVVEDRDPPVALIVTDSGEMEVPYIGRVKAAGRTCKALATAIRSALEVDYFYRATVIVALDSISTQVLGKITVSGEVLTQGSQEIPAGGLTVNQALANAGGINRFGDERKIKIIRKMPDGSTNIVIFDSKKFLQKGGKDIPLQTDDTVNVPTRIFIGL